MSEDVIICTDLDRTLMPNGNQVESTQARPRLRQLVTNENIFLAYVSGRHKALVLDAIKEYNLPIPDYVIGDVGTTIYETKSNNWSLWQAWQDEIASDWDNYTGEDIHH